MQSVIKHALEAAYNSGDYETALRLLWPLAEQGDALAQYYLGVTHRDGLSVPQDYAHAVKWYRRAAEPGYAAAQFNLGVMYQEGRGVPQDYAESVKWYRLAAKQGHALAQTNLGVMYYRRHVLQRPGCPSGLRASPQVVQSGLARWVAR